MTPAAPPAAVADPARLLAELTAARIVSADRGTRLLAEFRQAGSHGTFLDHLLASGLVTPYQADKVQTGQASTLLLGPYLLQEPVGTGSLGSVFRAVHRGDRRRFAVKVLPLRSLWNVLQAKKQVRTLAALPPHPAVVPLADIDTAGQAHFLAWPFVEGETFESLLRRTGPLPPAHAARLMAEVAEGLAALHAHGITHGVLKPANLLLGSDGRPRLLDVGMGAILAENIAQGESLLDTISTANSAINSFDYAAPETILDPAVRTPAADVYSFGCVLYALLAGSPPFPDGNAVDKMLAHQTQPPPDVRDKSPLVPDALAELVDRLMQKAPTARPTDLPAVRVGLLAAAEDKSGSGTVRTGAAHRALPAVDTNPPTDPPRLTPDAPGTNPDFDSQPLSVALSLLRSKLTGGVDSPQADGTPESVNFDLPDPDAPPPGLPGLIDTGPPGLFAQLASAYRPTEPAAPPSTPVEPPKAKSSVVAPPGPAVPVALHPTDLTLPPPSSRRVYATPPAEAAPPGNPGFFRRARSAIGEAWSRLSRAASQVLPQMFGAPPVELQVSIFGPKYLEPGKTVRLQVYVHAADAFASVCTLSRALQPNSEVLAMGQVARPVKRGEQIGLHLSVRNGGLSRSLTAFAWQGKPKAEPFELLVPWESQAGRTPAALTVGLNNVQAGKIAFELSVLPRSG